MVAVIAYHGRGCRGQHGLPAALWCTAAGNGYPSASGLDGAEIGIIGGGGVTARSMLHKIRHPLTTAGVVNRHMSIFMPTVIDAHHIAVLRHIVGIVFDLLEALSAADQVARHIFAVAVYLDALRAQGVVHMQGALACTGR